MMTFKVECWEESKTGFDTAIKISPDYIWSVMSMPKHYPLPWPRMDIGVIMNLRDAEEFAAERAIYHATILNKKVRTKVMRITELNRKKSSEIIWEDGKLIARDLWPWWRWVLLWFTGYGRSWDNKKKEDAKDQKAGTRAGVAHPEKAGPVSKGPGVDGRAHDR